MIFDRSAHFPQWRESTRFFEAVVRFVERNK